MTGQEKLPDGLECCFKALAKAVFSEEGTVYFHRTFISFDGSDRTRVITRYANMATEKGGDIAVAAKAVMIYPAIKWLLKAREIEAVIAALPEEAAQGDFCRLVGMQSMLVRLTGEKPEMRLQVRREFFERCQEFTDVVFKAVLESVYRKSTRKNMARPRLAMLLLGEDDGVAGQEEISTHTIKTYYPEIIEAVAAHSGEQIRTLMSGLMPDTGPKTAELAVLYHNTDLLLREYARIVRGYCADGQKLLGTRENRYIEQRREQSVLVAEYVKLIRGAVEMTKDFPGSRGDIYTVLDALTSDGSDQKTDAELAREVCMSAASFSREKGRALSVLGAVLWGCDANALTDLLI